MKRLLGAVVLGVATLFQPKADPKQHWSIPPTFPVDEQSPDRTDPQPLR